VKFTLNPIRALLDDCASLEEFRDRLASLFPGMDKSALAAVLRDAMLAAELAGRWEVINED
jgi:phage gp29-like protein